MNGVMEWLIGISKDMESMDETTRGKRVVEARVVWSFATEFRISYQRQTVAF